MLKSIIMSEILLKFENSKECVVEQAGIREDEKEEIKKCCNDFAKITGAKVTTSKFFFIFFCSLR